MTTPPPVTLRQPDSPVGVSRLLHAIPNLIVLSLLGGTLYWGHHTGWKMPRMSTLLGQPAIPADDWCPEHLIPESLCVECNQDLYPKPQEFGFCQDHGVAECVLCHPELSQRKADAPPIDLDTRPAIALLPRPENNSRNTLHKSRIQFASAESLRKYGIEIDLVQERAMADEIRANGEIVFDPTRVAHLSTKVPGTVVTVFKTVGDRVQRGEIVALVDAASVGQAKTQLLQSLVQLQLQRQTVQRLRPIGNSGAVSPKTLIEAEAALQGAEVLLLAARQTLANLGFELPEDLESLDPKVLAGELRYADIPADKIASLPAGRRTANLIPVLAPLEGVVVSSEIVAGEVVDPSQQMSTIADLRRMWLLLNVRQEDARYMRHGLEARFVPDDGSAVVAGVISWISPTVEQQTRTLQVRVVLDNPDGRLRDGTFGAGHILLRKEPRAIVVPRSAVQSTPDAHFVFIRDKRYFEEGAPKVFHVRQVRLGASDGEFVELLAGALPGEVVAAQGSNVLLGQLLRANLGAGCGCHEK